MHEGVHMYMCFRACGDQKPLSPIYLLIYLFIFEAGFPTKPLDSRDSSVSSRQNWDCRCVSPCLLKKKLLLLLLLICMSLRLYESCV